MSAAAGAIVVEGLVKSYGAKRAVDGLTLSVDRGQLLALLGPNGAGKTTTVEILEGYRRADAGRVRVLGLDPWTEPAALKPRVGLMLQQGGVYPAAYPLEMLRLLASFYDRPRDPATLLAQVGLAESARTRFRRLSGGQKQRLLLALALVGRPEVLFLDEPTAAMDPQARRTTWDLILAQRAEGATIVLTTHFMEEAERLADRAAIIDQGRLVAFDSPRALLEAGLEGCPTLSFRTRAGLNRAALARALGADRVDEPAPGLYQAGVRPTPADVERLAAYLTRQSALLEQLRIGHRTLEELFLALTGHGLRD